MPGARTGGLHDLRIRVKCPISPFPGCCYSRLRGKVEVYSTIPGQLNQTWMNAPCLFPHATLAAQIAGGGKPDHRRARIRYHQHRKKRTWDLESQMEIGAARTRIKSDEGPHGRFCHKNTNRYRHTLSLGETQGNKRRKEMTRKRRGDQKAAIDRSWPNPTNRSFSTTEKIHTETDAE